MKKIKECDHCEKKFRNRRSLRNHLETFHYFSLRRKEVKPVPKKEGKPQRRIRMMMHAARRQHERDLVSRKAHNHGVSR